jgi:hypothetical protein
MNNELERMWKVMVVTKLVIYSDIDVEGLRKMTEDLSQNSRSPGLNQEIRRSENYINKNATQRLICLKIWYGYLLKKCIGSVVMVISQCQREI